MQAVPLNLGEAELLLSSISGQIELKWTKSHVFHISAFSKVLLLEVNNSFLDYGMSVGRRRLVHPLRFNCEKIRISLDKGLE